MQWFEQAVVEGAVPRRCGDAGPQGRGPRHESVVVLGVLVEASEVHASMGVNGNRKGKAGRIWAQKFSTVEKNCAQIRR